MVINGTFFWINCPYCKEITKAQKLLEEDNKLKCLSCFSWISKEKIISIVKK